MQKTIEEIVIFISVNGAFFTLTAVIIKSIFKRRTSTLDALQQLTIESLLEHNKEVILLRKENKQINETLVILSDEIKNLREDIKKYHKTEELKTERMEAIMNETQEI